MATTHLPRKPSSLTRKYAVKWGTLFKVPPSWLSTIAFIESSDNPLKVNMARDDKGGAWGLMQQMADEVDYKIQKIRETRIGKTTLVRTTLAKWTGIPSDLLDPDLNMLLGTWQIANLKRRFGRFEYVIAAYHQGDNAVRQRIEEGKPVVSPTAQPKGYEYLQRAIVAQNFMAKQETIR
jgi:soluble lytic murein transglycosylase-like protein